MGDLFLAIGNLALRCAMSFMIGFKLGRIARKIVEKSRRSKGG